MVRTEKQLALRLERIKIANWLLEWLDGKHMYRGANAYATIIAPFAKEKGIAVYEVWQAWDILKEAGNRSAQPGNRWSIISWEPIEADADGNIREVSDGENG